MASRVKELADEEAARAEAEAPDEPETTATDDGEEEAEAEAAETPDTEPEAQAPSTVDVEKAQRAIDRLRQDNERRLRKIMGADFDTLLPSPLDDVPGYCFPIPPEQRDPAQVAAVRELIEPAVPFQTLKGARRCPDCDGWGVVLTTARNELNATTNCLTCSSRGWIQEQPITQLPPPSGAYSHANVPQNGTEALAPMPPRPEPYFDPATQTWKLP